jgi:ribosomal-protein-alanine N-acetyltransferase
MGPVSAPDPPAADPARPAARVRLRRPTIADEERFLGAVRASEGLHRGWATPPATAAAYALYLERLASPAVEGFLVVGPDDDALLGRVTLSQIFRGDFLSAYLGYEAFAGHERRGHLTAGVALLLDRAFGPLGLHRIEANVQPGNVASLALVRRLGFRREGLSPRYLRIAGEWRDHERWAILAEEHHARASLPLS